MKIKTIINIAILSVFSLQGYAQVAKLKKADKQYNQYAYIDAISTYERIAGKGYKDEDMFRKLGNAYYFNADLANANKWYNELFEMNPEQEPEYYYRYSQTLKSTGDYAKAEVILEQFYKKSGNDQRAKLFHDRKDYLEVIKENSGRYIIEDAGINSKYSDYGSAFFGGKLVFASARDTGGVSKKVFKWTNQFFTNLYESQIESEGKLSQPNPLNKKINSKFHESSPVFTKDGKTMYFTRNNFLEGKKKNDGKGTVLLKLYRATLIEREWQEVVEMPFDSDQYSVAHPALSPDEKTLYFVSDMPGTIGQSDLYKVKINSDGTYGTPENLGNTINTEGRETFPFVSDKDELYFASDGYPGLGGLDIFVSKIKKDGFKDPQNVGAPVNGPQDDFAFLKKANSKTGFFTSNREGGKGYDDIYSFLETRKLNCEQTLFGTITQEGTGKILVDAKVILFDDKFQFIEEILTDKEGRYSFIVECGKSYYVRAAKPDYSTKEGKVTIEKKEGETELSLALIKLKCEVVVGDDLGKCLGIKLIYFDLDKSFIRPDAAFQLEKVLDVLKQYSSIRISIRSHTDSRNTAKYNEDLSERRAVSTMNWFIENGIDPARLTAKGYGESQLTNKCSDGVKCTEEEHQANRRSEFIITAME